MKGDRTALLRASKDAERRVCRMCGSERTGPSGRQGPDCDEKAPWCIQVKRAARPQLPAAWLDQAIRDAAADPQRRPWLLVQVCPRPGREALMLATFGVDLPFGIPYAAFEALPRLHHNRSRPSLSRGDTAWVEAGGIVTQFVPLAQPWLRLYTWDYRLLCAAALG